MILFAFVNFVFGLFQLYRLRHVEFLPGSIAFLLYHEYMPESGRCQRQRVNFKGRF